MGFDNAKARPSPKSHIITYTCGQVYGRCANRRMKSVCNVFLTLWLPDCYPLPSLSAVRSSSSQSLRSERVNPDVESSSKNSDGDRRSGFGFGLLAVLARPWWPRWWRRWASSGWWRPWRAGWSRLWSRWRPSLTIWFRAVSGLPGNPHSSRPSIMVRLSMT